MRALTDRPFVFAGTTELSDRGAVRWFEQAAPTVPHVPESGHKKGG